MSDLYRKELHRWLEIIERNHPSEIEMGLDRTLAVYSKIRKNRLAKQVVMVAGTNGKGSTIAILERLLLDSGRTVGVYSSPHITDYNERIRINGKNCDDRKVVEGFEAVESVRNGIPLTYFEFGTLAALYCLDEEQLDVVLLEVGLGGRLDAVNIVDADLAIITSVDIDHTEWLGNDRESIGYEKAGIFRHKTPAIYGSDNPPQSVLQQALAQNIDLLVYQEHFGLLNQSGNYSDFSWLYQRQNIAEYSPRKAYVCDADAHKKAFSMPRTLLPESNVITALQAMECLGIAVDDAAIHKSLDGFSVAGRFQVISSNPLTLLDVGHNPHAARFLSRRLREIRGDKPVIAVFSVLADKDVDGIVTAMAEQVNEWHVAPLSSPRAMELSAIKEVLSGRDLEYVEHDSMQGAYKQAVELAAEKGGIVICFGSFHVVSDIH